MRFLQEEEAVKAMGLFEGTQDSNRVTKSALKNWAVSKTQSTQSTFNLYAHNLYESKNGFLQFYSSCTGFVYVFIELNLIHCRFLEHFKFNKQK